MSMNFFGYSTLYLITHTQMIITKKSLPVIFGCVYGYNYANLNVEYHHILLLLLRKKNP